MLGSANARMVLSTAISSTGSISTASATQARRGVALDCVAGCSLGIKRMDMVYSCASDTGGESVWG